MRVRAALLTTADPRLTEQIEKIGSGLIGVNDVSTNASELTTSAADIRSAAAELEAKRTTVNEADSALLNLAGELLPIDKP